MSAIMSPNAPQNELAGMKRADELLSAQCRAGWSSRQVISFCEQAYNRLVSNGCAEYADGFRIMGYIIAQERG